MTHRPYGIAAAGRGGAGGVARKTPGKAVSAEKPQKGRRNIERSLETRAHQFEWLYRRSSGEIFSTEVQVTVIEVGGRRIFLSIIIHKRVR